MENKCGPDSKTRQVERILKGSNKIRKHKRDQEGNKTALEKINYMEIYNSESEVAQSCPTLCDPVDCSLPGSSIHGILQARVLEWVAISFSRGSRPRDQTRVSCIAGRCLTL